VFPPGAAIEEVARSGDAWIGHTAAAGHGLVLGNSAVEARLALRDGTVPATESVRAAGADAWMGDGSPELRLEFSGADGVTWTERDLRYAGRDVARSTDGTLHLSVRFKDAASGLALTQRYDVLPAASAVVRTLTLSNGGDAPLALLRVDPLAATFIPQTPGGGWTALSAATNTGFARQALTPDQPLAVGVPPGGGAKTTIIPSFLVSQSETGGGLFGGVLWSANYHLTVSPTSDGRLVVAGGEDTAGLALLPGEHYEAPAAFLGAYRGDFDAGSRALQRFLQDSRDDAADALRLGLPQPPVTWNSWYAYNRDVSEDQLMAEADVAAAVGIDVFYVDHGWERALGDWRAREDRFTSGSLRTLSDYVHAKGMRFGAWIAFGVTDPNAAVAVQHPEWLAGPLDGSAPEQIDGAQLLCLAPARDWVLAELDRAVRVYRLDWLKYDQGMIGSCAPEGADAATVAASLRENTLAFYDILATLRQRFPTLTLENCYDGAGYLDNALYGLTDYAWLTDAAGNPSVSPVVLQQAFAGASRALPAGYLTSWLAYLQPGDEGAVAYRALSTMAGAWGLSVPLTTLTPAQRSTVAGLIAQYKRLRPYIAGGDLYHLSDPSDEDWLTLGYVLPDAAGAAVLVVRNGTRGEPAEQRRIVLPGFDPDATYAVAWDGASGRGGTLPETISGAKLMDEGLPLGLGAQQGGVILITHLTGGAASE
jgi:alpha-galactosidase